MIKKIFWALLALLIAAIVALALSYFRPWATYRPSTMNSMFKPDLRIGFFRGMDQVFPKRDLAASTTPAPFAAGPSMPLPPTFTHEGQSVNTAKFLDDSDTTSLLVIKRGQLVLERYGEGADRESRHTSWSVAKSFVSTLVGMAVAEGKIRSLDDPVSVYLPELAGKPYGAASVRHVLQMGSGVVFDETYHSLLSDINWLFYRTFILGQRVNEVVAGRAQEAAPGTRFKYISSDTQILASLLTRVYGQTLTSLVQQNIWQPLGMESSAYWSIDRDRKDGQELGFCCLNATARDYAKLGQLYLQNGQWQGRQLLSREWVQAATTPQAAWQQPTGGPESFGYAYQWWVPGWSADARQTEFMARGHWGQHIYVNTETQVVIVRTSVDAQHRANMPMGMALYRTLAKM